MQYTQNRNENKNVCCAQWNTTWKKVVTSRPHKTRRKLSLNWHRNGISYAKAAFNHPKSGSHSIKIARYINENKDPSLEKIDDHRRGKWASCLRYMSSMGAISFSITIRACTQFHRLQGCDSCSMKKSPVCKKPKHSKMTFHVACLKILWDLNPSLLSSAAK